MLLGRSIVVSPKFQTEDDVDVDVDVDVGVGVEVADFAYRKHALLCLLCLV